MSNLHPIFTAALAHWTPPVISEATKVKADLAANVDKAQRRFAAEQHRAFILQLNTPEAYEHSPHA